MSEYRYSLERVMPTSLDVRDRGCRVLFVMLNPSTADEHQDDPTIRRCKGFAARWGFDRLEVVNLYALRSTDPRRLFDHDDPVGPESDEAIATAAGRCRLVVVAWGAARHPGGRDRIARVLELVEFYSGRTVECLGRTASGEPRHPLYVPRDAQREIFTLHPRGAWPDGHHAPDHSAALDALGEQLEQAMANVDRAAEPLFTPLGIGD